MRSDKKRPAFALALFVGALVATSFRQQAVEVGPDTPVYAVLRQAGMPAVGHEADTSAEAVRRGYEIVHKGKTDKPGGGRSSAVSVYYQCTSCHNVDREDPDLTASDPEARLAYAEANDLPFLQATTFWGAVNRETWYNGDYFKKYGELIEDARTDLVESMQVCAQYCAQGRKLEEWETESLKAYFWTLQMKLGDLDLSQKEYDSLSRYLSEGQGEEASRLVKSKYLTYSPATFVEPPADKAQGYPHEGDPENGALVYKRSCRNCHHAYGESDVTFDYARRTFRWLRKHLGDDDRLSVYEIVRHGTYSEKGHAEYMPLYPLEKLSDKQVEDLVAFIRQEAQ